MLIYITTPSVPNIKKKTTTTQESCPTDNAKKCYIFYIKEKCLEG